MTKPINLNERRLDKAVDRLAAQLELQDRTGIAPTTEALDAAQAALKLVRDE